MRHLILAQSEVTARALGAWLELLGERPLQVHVEDIMIAVAFFWTILVCLCSGRLIGERNNDA